MKNVASAIGRQIEPAYGIEPVLHHATLAVALQVEAQTWNLMDGVTSDGYWEIMQNMQEVCLRVKSQSKR